MGSSSKGLKVFVQKKGILDELNDLERLISICRGNITEDRRASIHDVRSLFKELESNDCLGIDCFEIVKEILTQTEKTDLLKEVREFEQLQSRENNASVNSTCAQPPPGNCGAFARLVSPGDGAFANDALPGGWQMPGPREVQHLQMPHPRD